MLNLLLILVSIGAAIGSAICAGRADRSLEMPHGYGFFAMVLGMVAVFTAYQVTF